MIVLGFAFLLPNSYSNDAKVLSPPPLPEQAIRACGLSEKTWVSGIGSRFGFQAMLSALFSVAASCDKYAASSCLFKSMELGVWGLER